MTDDVRGDRSERLPLSAAQLGIWFAHQLDPTGHAFTIAECLTIRGAIDPPLFEAAARQVAGEVDALRVRLGQADGEPWQVVDPASVLTVTFLDMTGEARPQEAALAWMDQDASQSVDLLRDPLASWTLFKVAAERYLWCYRYHHLMIDGYSLPLIARRMADVYSALVQGRCPDQGELAPLRVLIEEDAAYRDSQQFHADREYWTSQFVGRAEQVNFDERPPQATDRVMRERTNLVRSRMDGLRAVAQRAGLTWPRLMIVATAVHRQRVTGVEDVVVGVPVAGRTNPLTRRVPGMATNVVHVRLTVRTGNTLAQTLTDAVGPIHEAIRRQHYRHEDLLRELRPLGTDSLLRGPTINVRPFDYNIRFAGHPVTVQTVTRAPIDDLAIGVYDRGDGGDVSVVFEANPALYSRDELQSHQSGFLTVLDALGAGAHQVIGRIDSPSHHGRQEIPPDDPVSDPVSGVTALGSSQTPLSSGPEASAVPTSVRVANAPHPNNAFCEFAKRDIESSVVRRFDEQVARYRGNDAIVTAGHRWTYRTLDLVAERTAHAVRGAGPSTDDQLVGLLFGPGAPMVAAMLGTMRSGRAYVPLDPCMPLARLSSVARNASVGVVLTDSAMLPVARRLQVAGRPEVVNIDFTETEYASSAAEIRNAPGPDDLAYVLYTSGSTGEPKGVMQNHRNVLHFIRSYTNSSHLCAQDRLSLLSSYAFDAAVMDIYGAILNGASLYPFDVRVEGLQALAPWIAAHRITVLHATPTLFRAFAATCRRAEDLASVRLVVLGGEPAYRSDFELFKRHFPEPTILVNGLGPTESTISLRGLFDTRSTVEQSALAVGHAVEETEVFLLDNDGLPVTGRQIGEIAIKSRHVALGYWRKPVETRAVFLPDPARPGTTTYLTGDLGRALADGSIAFVGRKDDQVKIRGFRVEPGEIESALAAHADVSEAAVVARVGRGREKRLVAYVVSPSPTAPSSTELRRHVAQVLPAYMVPSVFVVLPRLPRTANGKLDRRALPAPERRRPALEEVFVAHRTQREEALAAIWAEVLDVERVGVNDDFFELGGHSLLATRLIMRVRATLGVQLDLRTVFECPTVAGVADRLTDDGPALLALRPRRRPDVLPLSFAQGRLWFLDQLEGPGASPAYHIARTVRTRVT